MRIPLQKFLDHIKRGGQLVAFATVLDWLKSVGMTDEEWGELSPHVRAAYGVESEDELYQTLKPVAAKEDFLSVMRKLEIGGWLRDVTEWTKDMEAPASYSFGSALAILSATLRRRVWVSQGYFNHYPAVQVLLAGPAGMRKSTAGSTILRLGVEAKGFNLLPDEGSGEALKSELASLTNREGEATGLIFVSELSTFLGKQEYNLSLVQQLTDLFDSHLPREKRRKTVLRGNEVMKDIAISALFCSNEAWLAEAVPSSAFGGGLFGRMLIFHEPKKTKCFPEPQVRDPARRQDLLARLARVSVGIKGEAVREPLARKLFDKIYRAYDKTRPKDERLEPYYERIGDHILKVALLLSVSEDPAQRDGVKLTEQHIQQADGLVSWITDGLPALYAHLGNTRFGNERAKILRALSRHGGRMPDQDLGRFLGTSLPRKVIDEHLRDLERSGVVELTEANPWEGKKVWKLVKEVK